MRTSLLSGLAAGFVLIVATACGGSSATTKPATSAAASQPAASQAASEAAGSAAAAAPTCSSGPATGGQVGIAGFKFTPDPTTASAGGTVTWTNADSATHTVTFDNGPDCGQVATGASVTATFSAPGTYAYHCTIHSKMKGTVTVS